MPIEFDLATIQNFAIAILIGALVGIEREKRRNTEQTIGGIRTFVLLALLGAVGGYLSARFNSPWPFLVVVALASLTLVAGFLIDADDRKGKIGLVTELSAIAVTLLGGLATYGEPALAVPLGIVVAALLAFKQPLHGLIDRIGWDDIFAGLRLLIASFIVLPLLPDRTIDPWDALNPRSLWLLVVLISALSMIGYVATRWLGQGRGAIVTGLTGGMVSSTAATLAFARQSRDVTGESAARALAVGTLVAWTIMFARVLFIAFAMNRTLLAPLSLTLVTMGIVSLACAGVLAWLSHSDKTDGKSASAELVVTTPFSLTQAMKFGLLYAVILLVVKIVSGLDFPAGFYVVAAIAGSTDVDAITLSMAQYGRDAATVQVAAISITIASISNTIVKGGIAVGAGSARFRRPMLISTAAIVAAGGAAILADLAVSQV
jgi:uncharacterized membrane protein (DUF4010 family)